MSIAIMLLVCFGASVIGAVSGIGGGVIIKPLLELVTPYSVAVISFLSGCCVLVMSVTALLRRRSELKGAFALRKMTLLALAAALGGVSGKLLFNAVHAGLGELRLGAGQSLVLGLIVALLIVYQLRRRKITSRRLQSPYISALLGFAMGLLSSFLGIGGGPFNVVIFNYFFSMESKRASLHSLYIILFSQTASLLLTLAMGGIPSFSLILLPCAVAGGVLGAFAGSAIAKGLDNRAVGRVYMAALVIVLAMAARNLLVYVT